MSTCQENVRNWKEFKLIITDPPSYSGHFELIKKELVPFVEKNGIRRFWVTNYFGQQWDYILFRIEIDERELVLTKNFLEELVTQKKIVRWDQPIDWNPKDDASARYKY